jgi:hypothetical protein
VQSPGTGREPAAHGYSPPVTPDCEPQESLI